MPEITINPNKPLLLFMPIYDIVAEAFVEKMNDIPVEDDIEVWINSPGGRVFAGWSIIGALQKRKGKTSVCVMGHAASMAFFFPLFADYSEALEVTKFMIHRADMYVETPEEQLFLDNINKDLRKQVEQRINQQLFTEITGVTFNDIFDPKQRKEVWINAKDAKKIGLINDVRKFTKKEIDSFSEKLVAFADFSEPTQEPTQRSEQPESNLNTNNNKNRVKMTLAEIMAQHPELVAQIQTGAVTAERERVGAYMAFLDVDKENVVKAVKEGTAFNSAVMAEMTVKLTAHVGKTKLEADGKGEKPKTDAEILAEKTAKEKDLETFEKEVESKTKKSIA